MIITPESRAETGRLSITTADIAALTPITISGLPKIIPGDMAEAITTLVCLAVVPLRHIVPTIRRPKITQNEKGG